MRITENLATKVLNFADEITSGTVKGNLGGGYGGKGYRITNMGGTQRVWLSSDGEARNAMAYYLGAIDAFTEGADMPEWLEEVRESVAWRTEVEKDLHAGRADAETARRNLIQKAEEIGRNRGTDHANYAAAYGGDMDAEPEVPARFTAVATYYTAAYAEGVAEYLADEN